MMKFYKEQCNVNNGFPMGFPFGRRCQDLLSYWGCGLRELFKSQLLYDMKMIQVTPQVFPKQIAVLESPFYQYFKIRNAIRVPSRALPKRLTNVDFIAFVSFLFCKNRGTIRVHSLFWAYSPYFFTHFCLPKHLIPTISVDITKA